jgi:hypothetical protein
MYEYEFDSRDAIEKFKEVKELINDIIKELEEIEPDD